MEAVPEERFAWVVSEGFIWSKRVFSVGLKGSG
jgi:hypothetical protein